MKLYQSKVEDNVSYIYLQDKDGIYKGKSRIHPDDQNENYRPFKGLRIAENRALIECYKSKIKKAKHQLEAVINLKKDFIFTFSEENIPKEYLKRFNLKIRDYNKEIDEYKSLIKLIEDNIKLDYKLAERFKKDKNKEKI